MVSALGSALDSALDSEAASDLDSALLSDSDSALELPDAVLDDAGDELLVLWEELPELAEEEDVLPEEPAWDEFGRTVQQVLEKGKEIICLAQQAKKAYESNCC